jgi:hypothetical protein
MARRGDIEFDTLIPWLIGVLVLALVLFLYFKLGGKGGSALDAFKRLWKFGR